MTFKPYNPTHPPDDSAELEAGDGAMDRTVRYVESTTRERYENRIKRALELIGTIDGITGPAASALRKALTGTAGKPSTTE